MLEVTEFLVVELIFNVPIVEILLEHDKDNSQQCTGSGTDGLPCPFFSLFPSVEICEWRLWLPNQREDRVKYPRAQSLASLLSNLPAPLRATRLSDGRGQSRTHRPRVVYWFPTSRCPRFRPGLQSHCARSSPGSVASA